MRAYTLDFPHASIGERRRQMADAQSKVQSKVPHPLHAYLDAMDGNAD